MKIYSQGKYIDILCVYLSTISFNILPPPITDPGRTETGYNPHLVVASPEIHHVARLEVARLRTALLLRVAGLWVLLCVLPAMMQQQQHTYKKEDP